MYMYRSFWKRHTLREWFSQVQKDFSITFIYCSTENTDDHPTNTSHLCIECNHALLSRSWCSSRETVTNNYRPWTWIKLQLYNIYIYIHWSLFTCDAKGHWWFIGGQRTWALGKSHQNISVNSSWEIIYSRSCNQKKRFLPPPKQKGLPSISLCPICWPFFHLLSLVILPGLPL